MSNKEPEVVAHGWLSFFGLWIARGIGERYPPSKTQPLITLQAHREAMAQVEGELRISESARKEQALKIVADFGQWQDMQEALAKKDAALAACVEIANKVQMHAVLDKIEIAALDYLIAKAKEAQQ